MTAGVVSPPASRLVQEAERQSKQRGVNKDALYARFKAMIGNVAQTNDEYEQAIQSLCEAIKY